MSRSDRHALVRLTNAGLLLDLASGAVFQLNDSAAFIWQMWLDEYPFSRIAHDLASRYGLDEQRAHTDAAAALAVLDRAARETTTVDDFSYTRTDDGYVQSVRGQPSLAIDLKGERLTVASPLEETKLSDLRGLIRAMAPKILSLRGHIVMHAAGVSFGDRVILFMGASGAGKTSTARALAQAGATPICVDRVLLHLDGSSVKIWPDSEGQIDAWIRRATLSVLADREALCEDLDDAASGSICTVAEVGLVDATRRTGTEIVVRELSQLDAAGAHFGSAFLGSDARAAWIRHLRTAATLGEVVPTVELTVPDGLDNLKRAACAVAERRSLRAR